jgi:hypothetical protein
LVLNLHFKLLSVSQLLDDYEVCIKKGLVSGFGCLGDLVCQISPFGQVLVLVLHILLFLLDVFCQDLPL